MHENGVPIVKAFKNAQECNSAVKRQRNFLLSQHLPSLHFFLPFAPFAKITISLHLKLKPKSQSSEMTTSFPIVPLQKC